MILLIILTILPLGPSSPEIEVIRGEGANGPSEEMMKVEREEEVKVTCELVEDLVKAIIGNWNPGKPTEKKDGQKRD